MDHNKTQTRKLIVGEESAVVTAAEDTTDGTVNGKMARKDIDTLLGYLGRPGRYQIFIFFLLMWMYVPMCFNCLAMVLFSAKPSGVRCGAESKHTPSLLSQVPEPASYGCHPELSLLAKDSITECSKYGSQGSLSVGNFTLCSDCSWEFQFSHAGEKTIISEFELICEDSWQTGLATTLFFLGMVFGGPIFGFVSDRHGRKPALLASSVFALAAGFGVTFAPTYIWFLVFRFLIGFSIQGAALQAFTMMIETFSREYREFAGVGSQLVWAVAVILLAGFGYLLPDWRHLQLLITLSVLVVVLYTCFLKESLRWLYSNQRFEQATEVTNHILRFNSKERTKKLTDCVDYLTLWYHKEHDEDDSSNSFWNLFTSPQLRKRVLGMSYIWFTASIWYYLISFAITDFFGNKYINLAVAGTIDIPITVASMFIVKRYGCRWPMLYSLVVGGVLAIIAGCLPTDTEPYQITRTVFGQLSRGAAHAVFNLMFPYASDLLPTTVRANGLGLCSSALRLGGVLAPQLLLLGTYSDEKIPFVLCGLMAIVGAGVTYFLPETRGVSLPETVEDLHIHQQRRSRVAIEMQ